MVFDNAILVSSADNASMSPHSIAQYLIMTGRLAVLAMAENEKIVVLQVDVRESIRTRLRVQAVKMGVTMGELTERILDEALKKLEEKG